MSLLSIPPELRMIIFDFCFPPVQTCVQIIPYRTSLPACRLNLPVALYSVCKAISSELEPLQAKLRRLDFTYIIRGPVLTTSWRPEYDSKHDDDPEHFAFIMRFAERIRLVGSGPIISRGRGTATGGRALAPGPECALKVLEVQPRAWRRWYLARIMMMNLCELTTHADVAERLEVRLIRDTEDPLEDVEALKGRMREWQKRREENGRDSEGRWSVNLATLDQVAGKEVKTNIRRIEAWLQRFQDVTDVWERADTEGPLAGYDDDDDSA
ncbi:hypothetical protein C8F04DRAFT_234300 [Mycena alexandri]|uniref:F-box domain-containing protein n=1 Tax=Mycena alexandri TaxID=1745969 RepID=A0AAD6S7Q3_9AGAR|nr:hypothetical protein C8F04DRAFT_234300 [Mycena alexandri]